MVTVSKWFGGNEQCRCWLLYESLALKLAKFNLGPFVMERIFLLWSQLPRWWCRAAFLRPVPTPLTAPLCGQYGFSKEENAESLIIIILFIKKSHNCPPLCLPPPLLPKAPPQLAQCNEVGFAGKRLACKSLKVVTTTLKGNSGDYFPSLFICALL